MLSQKKIIKFILLFLIILFYNFKIIAKNIHDEFLVLNGSFVQGGILFGETKAKYKIFYNKKEIFINENGSFILGLGRDEKKENLIMLKTEKEIREYKINVDSRKYKIQRINNLPKNKVTPNEEELKRIKKESKLIIQSKNFVLEETFYKKGFIWPLKGIITGEYGNQRILNGKKRRPHLGLDIAAPSGTKIIAPCDGKVVMTFEDTFLTEK